MLTCFTPILALGVLGVRLGVVQMGKIVFISRPARAKAGYINKEGKDAIFILGLYGCYISIGSLWMLFFSLSF